MQIADKNELKAGDLIWFHSWGVGGFLFGVVIEHEDYHSELNIWRPAGIYPLQAHGIDGIEKIEKIEDVRDYALYDFYEFLNAVKLENVNCNFCL